MHLDVEWIVGRHMLLEQRCHVVILGVLLNITHVVRVRKSWWQTLQSQFQQFGELFLEPRGANGAAYALCDCLWYAARFVQEKLRQDRASNAVRNYMNSGDAWDSEIQI